jgi:hypothetical protein
VAILLITSGSRRVWVMASSCFCVRVRMVASPFRASERESLVGHHDAGQHALEMARGVRQQRLQVVGARSLGMTAGHRQQQLEILVARGQVFVELLDVGARQQVAAQQLERGRRWSCTYENGSTLASFASRLQTTATTAARSPRSSRSQNR